MRAIGVRDDQIFGLVAGVALLVWLIGYRWPGGARGRRRTAAVALGLIAAGIVYALVLALLSLRN